MTFHVYRLTLEEQQRRDYELAFQLRWEGVGIMFVLNVQVKCGLQREKTLI